MKQLYQSAASYLVCRTALLGELLALSALNSLAGQSDLGWTRDVTDRMHPGTAFELIVTSSVAGRLSAECGYQYINKESPVVLHGTKDSDDEFSPFVSYEVATEGTIKWKTIGKFTESQNPTTIEISSANPKVGLHVDMETFRSSIGRFRWGRIVLENGEAAAFAIDDLLPPGNSADAAGNFKQNLFDSDPLRFGGSFSLLSLTSFSNRLVGDFVFIRGPKGASVEIKGTRTPDGDFWPSATFQAGNSDLDWQTLGKSTNEGVPTSIKVVGENPLKPLRVPLDRHKAVIGRFKYGKIIFSGGEFAVFEIVNLKPTSRQGDNMKQP
jgi:hypothetical protein